MKMQELKLDGNGIAGLLGEVFALEPTAGRGTCDGCGAEAAVGALDVYVHAPGVVVRCPSWIEAYQNLRTKSGRLTKDGGETRWRWLGRAAGRRSRRH